VLPSDEATSEEVALCWHHIYRLYFAMTAANNKTHTVKEKEKKEKEKNTQHTIVNIKRKA